MGKPGPKKVHRYSVEFKLTAVKLSHMPGVEIQTVAAALDIHPFMLSPWRKGDACTNHLSWAKAVSASRCWAPSPWPASSERLLRVVSNGSFPAHDRRSNLSPGERRQLRDAMILSTHIREGRDILVTNDAKGFIQGGRRELLEPSSAPE